MKANDTKRLRLNRLSDRRNGAAVVEFAVVLPVIVLLLMGSMEVGRAVMVKHVLEETARAGCRVAAFGSSTKQDVLNIVETAMSAAKIDNYTVTIDPDPPDNLGAFEPVTVSVAVPYADVSWGMASRFMAGKTLTGRCVMPAEGFGASSSGGTQPPSTKKNKKSDTKKSSNKKS